MPADVEPTYCEFSEFATLCADETPPLLLKFLWQQFKLHRAVSTLAMIEEHCIKNHKIRMTSSTSAWEQLTIEEIMKNIQVKVSRLGKMRVRTTQSTPVVTDLAGQDRRVSIMRQKPVVFECTENSMESISEDDGSGSSVSGTDEDSDSEGGTNQLKPKR